MPLMRWLTIVLLLIGQTSAVSFEAASIKRNISGETRNRFETPPGRLNAINNTAAVNAIIDREKIPRFALRLRTGTHFGMG